MDDADRRLDAISGVFLLAREMRRHIGEVMAEERWATDAGFRPPCMGVIAVVDRLQPVSQREISERLGLDASDVVGVLDLLEKAGLVERRRDPQDRRRHAVVLTKAGERAARRFEALRAKVEAHVFACLSPEDRQRLTDLLNQALNAPAP